MAVPKRKKSKMKKRMNKAPKRYEGVQLTYCQTCGAPAPSHTVCKACGNYKGKQIITVS
ncbi:MAG: 50S ribosomal protein L32 [Lentisphaerae bacterium GWF2_52_8]|nr:MAG: 50S ribosomal protein L32 [Lentisphaerae bacterium GWF2_52_8]